MTAASATNASGARSSPEATAAVGARPDRKRRPRAARGRAEGEGCPARGRAEGQAARRRAGDGDRIGAGPTREGGGRTPPEPAISSGALVDLIEF